MLTKRTREKSAALLIAAGLTVLLLWFPGAAKEGVERGLPLTVRWLVPSLFPYMVLSSFLLRTGGGRHFFDPDLQDVYPEEDFRMCIDRDRFDFVIRVEKDADGMVARKVKPAQ